jgi:rhodanese-related sulfurtransferase
MNAPQLSVQETAEALASGAAVGIDVREPQEWEAGRISGVAWIPFGELAARAAELPADTRVVLICRSGARSGYAAEAFHSEGADVANMAGGMKAWVAAGLPIEPEDGWVL